MCTARTITQTGTFGDHVLSIRLQRTDGEEIVCGPAERADWFAATVGGLGLTGLIVEAELQLRRVPGPWLETETVAYAGLDEFFRLSDESHPAWEHAVSWIDCTAGDAGRGLFLRARPAADQQRDAWRARQLAMPGRAAGLVGQSPDAEAAQSALLVAQPAASRAPHCPLPAVPVSARRRRRLEPRLRTGRLLPVPVRRAARERAGGDRRPAGGDRPLGRRLGAGGAEDLRRALAAGPAELCPAGRRPWRSTFTIMPASRPCSSGSTPWSSRRAGGFTPPRMRACRARCSRPAIRASANLSATAIPASARRCRAG